MQLHVENAWKQISTHISGNGGGHIVITPVIAAGAHVNREHICHSIFSFQLAYMEIIIKCDSPRERTIQLRVISVNKMQVTSS